MGKAAPAGGLNLSREDLKSGFDLEPPSFQQGLRNVLGILVTPCPLAKASRTEVLVGSQLVLTNDLLKLSYRRGDGPDWLRLAPIRISASLCHEKYVPRSIEINTKSGIVL
jgi:hypothetical protein